MEEIPHSADYAFRVRAPTKEELFLNAIDSLYVLSEIQTGQLNLEESTMELKADDLEGLLIAFLNEIIYWMDEKRLQWTGLRWSLFSDTHSVLVGKTRKILKREKYIKAATYNNLHIYPVENGVSTEIVLDM